MGGGQVLFMKKKRMGETVIEDLELIRGHGELPRDDVGDYKCLRERC